MRYHFGQVERCQLRVPFVSETIPAALAPVAVALPSNKNIARSW